MIARMGQQQRQLLTFAALIGLWYLPTFFLPKAVDTCLDGNCGFSPFDLAVTFLVPLVLFAIPVVLEVLLYRKGLRRALSDIGVTRFSFSGLVPALIYLFPLVLFFPIFSLTTNQTPSLSPAWPWLVLSAFLINGLVEEPMMRGFVFRHFRESRSFWRAATLSTAYFAAYHLVLILTDGPIVGVIAVVIAIPTGFLTAYAYEVGDNTVWGPVLLHAGTNALAFTVAYPSDVQPLATSLYLLVGVISAGAVILGAFRSGFRGQRDQLGFGPQPAAPPL
jgi:membrane protease YdiL (CAAX protease family)